MAKEEEFTAEQEARLTSAWLDLATEQNRARQWSFEAEKAARDNYESLLEQFRKENGR